MFSACGHHLVEAVRDGYLRVREVPSGKIVFEQHQPGEMVRRIDSRHEGQRWFDQHTIPSHYQAATGSWGRPISYITEWEWPFVAERQRRVQVPDKGAVDT